MKVNVDHELCEANAFCVRECPEVFKVDEEDNIVVLMDEVAEGIIDKAKNAVRLCPRQAISLEE